MERMVEIDDAQYDVDTQRAEAHSALLASGEREVMVYAVDESGEWLPTVYYLRDSGSIHMGACR